MKNAASEKNVVKNDGTFLKVGRAELQQTGGERSQAIPPGQVCFSTSKKLPRFDTKAENGLKWVVLHPKI